MQKIVCFAALTVLGLTAVTQAAPISWGPATDVFSASEVVNSGTLIEAFNAGGNTSGSNVTVNGVLFTGTTALLSGNTDLDVFSRDTGDAAYNALLGSFDYGGGTELVSLEVGGGNLTVGTEYMIQVWYVDTRDTKQTPVGDGESSPNKVVLNSTPGQYATGTFVADGSTQTITLESPGFNNAHITAYQIRDRVSVEEMMTNLDNILPAFPDYSWDKVSRWGYGRKNGGYWTDAEIDIMGSRCKYIWIPEGVNESERFRTAYPDNMYCFNAYINLEKAYHVPNPFKPEYFLYNSGGGLVYYGSGHMKYNQANPDCRTWWVDKLSEFAYTYPKSDVVFIDSIQKALNIAAGDYYDYWGNPVSATYMEKAIIPLLETVRDKLSADFIVQGNFIRASTTYTEDSNLSYVSNYLHSSYLEGFEVTGTNYASMIHKGIDAVQQALAMGKMICPNFGPGKPWVCAALTLEEMRAKASQAMPVFWAKLGAVEQDELANMYAYFDFKLAIFLIMAGEHTYLRFSDEVLLNNAGTEMFHIVPPFPEFNRKLGAPLSDGVRINSTTWEREFEYCKVTLNVDAGIADIEWRSQPGVVYQSDFTGADLASAGLKTSAGVNGTWTLNTTNDWVTGTGSGNARANLYTTDSWQSSEGFTLNVTFKNNVNMVRHSLGIVDADYTISGSGDWLNSALAGAYGIGFSTAGSGPSDYLGFNNGSSVSVLSTAQGDASINTPQTMSITVTANSWSYSLNGAPATSGSFVTPFDTSKNYRFTAHAQDLRYQDISSITLTAISEPAVIGNMYLAVLPGGASNVLEWTAFPNHVYHVYWSSNLLDGFTLVGSNVPDGVFVDAEHAADPRGFYKLTIESQP